jgi:hypothetical protein
MNELDDYPLAPFVNGVNGAFGRVLLVALAVVTGAFLGGATAGHSLQSACSAVTTLPILVVSSIFFAVGIVSLPAIFIFAVVFSRSAWPLWMVLVATLLMWWNTHKILTWSLYDSPAARIEKTLNSELNARRP